MTDSLRDTIAPKSDQLNADDLLCGPITVTITAVSRGDKEQPVVVSIDGDRQPYKPCKSMRRVMIAAWGDRPDPWVGQRMTLYCDPEVKFGGVKVGGIRISHMSGLAADREFMLTTTRSKRAAYTVKPLVYDDSAFRKVLAKAVAAITEGRETPESIIEKLAAKGTLTSEERQMILNLGEQNANSPDA